MKRSKFGMFDIILAVAIIVGIGLNIYGASGGAEDANPAWNSPSQQSSLAVADSYTPPAQIAQAENPPSDLLPQLTDDPDMNSTSGGVAVRLCPLQPGT